MREMDANIPSELTGGLPRRVCATGNGIYLAFLALACLVFAISATLWAGINTVRQNEHRAALRRDGSVTAGEITRMRKGKNSETVYYSFAVNGKSYTGEAELPWQLRNNVEGSSFLDIRYLPTHPDVNHPVGWEWCFYWWLPLSTDLVHLPEFSKEFQWFMAAFIFGPVGFVFLTSLRRERKMLVDGAPAAGLVTGCTRGTRGTYLVKYEFRAKDGSVVSGKCSGERQEIGDAICVLYLRQDPRWNQLYSKGSYRVAE